VGSPKPYEAGIIILGSGVRVPLPLPIKSATSEITETINVRRTTVRTTFSVTNLHGRNSARFERRRSDGQHRTGRGARFLLISGSQVRALVRPPNKSSTYNTTHQNGPFGWEVSWEFLFAIRAHPLSHLLKDWRDGCALPQRLPRIPAAWSALSRRSLGDRGTPSPGIGPHPRTHFCPCPYTSLSFLIADSASSTRPPR
jgi:hypothetical protein